MPQLGPRGTQQHPVTGVHSMGQRLRHRCRRPLMQSRWPEAEQRLKVGPPRPRHTALGGAAGAKAFNRPPPGGDRHTDSPPSKAQGPSSREQEGLRSNSRIKVLKRSSCIRLGSGLVISVINGNSDTALPLGAMSEG